MAAVIYSMVYTRQAIIQKYFSSLIKEVSFTQVRTLSAGTWNCVTCLRKENEQKLAKYFAKNIDPMHKWRQFKYSFVYIQISPTSLILGNIFFESLIQERG